MWLPKYRNTDTVLTREAADRVEYIRHETTDKKGYSKPDCSAQPRSPVFGSLPKHSLALPLLAGSTTFAHGSTTTATPPPPTTTMARRRPTLNQTPNQLQATPPPPTTTTARRARGYYTGTPGHVSSETVCSYIDRCQHSYVLAARQM